MPNCALKGCQHKIRAKSAKIRPKFNYNLLRAIFSIKEIKTGKEMNSRVLDGVRLMRTGHTLLPRSAFGRNRLNRLVTAQRFKRHSSFKLL
jgi:hypothetical protein